MTCCSNIGFACHLKNMDTCWLWLVSTICGYKRLILIVYNIISLWHPPSAFWVNSNIHCSGYDDTDIIKGKVCYSFKESLCKTVCPISLDNVDISKNSGLGSIPFIQFQFLAIPCNSFWFNSNSFWFNSNSFFFSIIFSNSNSFSNCSIPIPIPAPIPP